MGIPDAKKALIDSLVSCVGQEHVLLGDDVSSRAKHVWNSAPRKALAIVRPANTEDVSEVLKLCFEARQCVVTHGGLTGLVDGDHTDGSDLVLSLERMRNIESVDSVGKTLTAQAGCVLEQVQLSAQSHDLSFGLDLGARGSCTIGGNLSTNAGGLSVLRYGMAREQVLGLEVVLMDGTVLSSMNALLKNNAGHDLKHLFIGTEGTLGVITRAVLRLRPKTVSCNTAMLACETFTQVTQLLNHLERELAGQLNAFEVLWKPVVELNTNPTLENTVSAPFELNKKFYVIAEARGAKPETDDARFESVISEAFETAMVSDGVIAQSEQERQNLWAIRENIELMLAHQPNYVFDISLPISAMDAYIENLDNALNAIWPNTKLFSYGHAADSNLHVIVAPPETCATTEDELNQQYEQVNRLVFDPLTELGGSISAEHGIGLSKKAWLSYTRNDTEIQVMRSIKQVFDPNELLNRGRIVDAC